MSLLFVVCCAFIGISHGWPSTGPAVIPTIGGVWPKPKTENPAKQPWPGVLIDPNNFKFLIDGQTCDILGKALKRYADTLKITAQGPTLWSSKVTQTSKLSFLKSIKIKLSRPCEKTPYFKMNESYYLNSTALISSDSIWGILRGLETFSQLVVPYNDTLLQVRITTITDEPRFSHRGLLLDTARHFIRKDIIYKILDGMAYNKLNVFHWHMIDDQSFPYQSDVYPELSGKGAYNPRMVYTQQDVANVVEYARLRGIRVIPEFDVPAHTLSWGMSHPELLAKCDVGEHAGSFGPINPVSNVSYDFLAALLKEASQVFIDQFIHLGGDEINPTCWQDNYEISEYVTSLNEDYDFLKKIFMERTSTIALRLGRIPTVWQDTMIDGIKLPKGSIVQVWKDGWQRLFKKYTAEGRQVLLSECWYLSNFDESWHDYYACEPHDFGGTNQQKELVVGGEACVWSEEISDSNVLQAIFPKVSAVAEKLWSQRISENLSHAPERLEEHTCRMITRGIPAVPPNGPGIC